MEISSKTQYLIGYGTHFDGHALGAGQLTQDGMFGDGESVADPRRVEQNGVDQVLVHVGSLPVGLAGVEEEAQIRVGGPAQQLIQEILEWRTQIFLTDQIKSGHDVRELSLPMGTEERALLSAPYAHYEFELDCQHFNGRSLGNRQRIRNSYKNDPIAGNSLRNN